MRLRRTALIAFALTLFALPLSGCEWQRLRIQIPDFDSHDVGGIWVWRLSEGSGQYVRDGQVVFSEPEIASGRERMHYEVRDTTGTPLYDFSARLVRSQTNPDTVTLRLQYLRISPSGSFKISSFNQQGDSDLSSGTLLW